METTSPPQVPGVELGALLGRGSSGEVWEGVLLAGSRPVAVKVAGGDADAAEAAVREASVACRVASEHVLGVEACTALPDGRVALVMPLMRGGSLAALVRARGHLGPGEVVTVLAPLAGALGRLHAAGVVHGDVSPGNVLLDLDGRPVLADLGVGRVLGEAPTAVWGTPGHLAPEVLMGAEPSAASDVYALGALGWLCLAGEVPGAPGLRPGLASVCRAGTGSEALVAAIEAAVHPLADERPDADELAWLLFGAAEPEPLHLVAGDDDVSAVTYRLRAAAGRPPSAPVAGDRPAGGRHRPPAARPRRRARLAQWRPVAAGLLATALVVLLAVLGSSALRDEPARAAPRPAPSSASPPVDEPAHQVADPRADPQAPAERAAELLEVLADARARAFREGDVRHLAGAEVADGPLAAFDRAAVGRLAAGGLRYAGLAYDVSGVRAVTAGRDSAVLRARIGTGAYRVEGSGAPRTRTASAGEPVLVDLRRTPDGWRVSGIRPG
ncbi:serine/threonine-protein kinase [Phycicoccus sonneratiae]|uniref:non-specific serine/threonine protein kinase n=1 Tax=Phycicoccus sonneratiae TaxID=2807628 RepID=A0ABS2CR90_9MICO|nr:serine/threonine-protein kinase [Phycicoccus sonneraticus]MBM6402409.1 serine/threonine protein kinase [Phycicoccus sonneraticus]